MLDRIQIALQNENLAEAWALLKEAKAYIEKTELYLKTQFEKNGPPPGITKRLFQTRRDWTDIEKVLDLFEQEGLSDLIRTLPESFGAVKKYLEEDGQDISILNGLYEEKPIYQYIVEDVTATSLVSKKDDFIL